jgi:hypothetical protein
LRFLNPPNHLPKVVRQKARRTLHVSCIASTPVQKYVNELFIAADPQEGINVRGRAWSDGTQIPERNL